LAPRHAGVAAPLGPAVFPEHGFDFGELVELLVEFAVVGRLAFDRELTKRQLRQAVGDGHVEAFEIAAGEIEIVVNHREHPADRSALSGGRAG
jgi:hypothetical protein